MTTLTGGEIHCHVKGEGKLSAELGGRAGVCAVLERAVVPVLRQVGLAPGAVAIVVDVKREDAITGALSVNGRSLPEMRVDVADGRITEQSLELLGRTMAMELEKLGRK